MSETGGKAVGVPWESRLAARPVTIGGVSALLWLLAALLTGCAFAGGGGPVPTRAQWAQEPDPACMPIITPDIHADLVANRAQAARFGYAIKTKRRGRSMTTCHADRAGIIHMRPNWLDKGERRANELLAHELVHMCWRVTFGCHERQAAWANPTERAVEETDARATQVEVALAHGRDPAALAAWVERQPRRMERPAWAHGYGLWVLGRAWRAVARSRIGGNRE